MFVFDVECALCQVCANVNVGVLKKLKLMDIIDGAAAAARHTGLTRRQIYRLVEAGHLPVVRMGRRLYFRASELDKAFSPNIANDA